MNDSGAGDNPVLYGALTFKVTNMDFLLTLFKYRIAGVCVTAAPCLSRDGLGVETSEEKNREAFETVMSRVRLRLAAYGS